MPPFGRVLSPRTIDELVEFLSSCRTEKAPGCRQWDAPAPPEDGTGSRTQ